MTTFAILTGKSLKSAITGYGKTASTFAERTHQLAYSALSHVEEHHDAIYCTAIYTATPRNYRLAIARWFLAFGKIAFDATTETFTYSKAKKSDLPAALVLSPADYDKAKGTAKDKKPLMERVESMLTKAIEDVDASSADKAFARAMANSLELYKHSLVRTDATEAAAPKASKPKVVKAKAAKQQPAAETFTNEPREDDTVVPMNGSIHRMPVDSMIDVAAA